MNMKTALLSPKVEVYNYFVLSLESFNQFKAQVHEQRPENNQPKETKFWVQKLGSNQYYNSFSKQILLQNSSSNKCTPKKQPIQEISQYLSDPNFLKKPTIQPINQQPQSIQQTPKASKLIIRPIYVPKLQQQLKQKLLVSYKKNKKYNQNEAEIKSQPLEEENKQQERMPKKGLTYISKKLSLILRQKKRIKSSQLFNISLFEDENEDTQQLQPLQALDRPSSQEQIYPKQEKQLLQLKDSKQRRNLRRRIYDSINVMIALGIIKKVKNQFIYIEQKDDITDTFSIIQQEQILAKKKDFMGKLQNDCLYKERCLKYLTEAYSKMRILRKLNSEYQDKMNTLNENTFTSTQTVSTCTDHKIQFPFILAQNGSKQMKVQLINQTQQAGQRIKKINDWTDYIDVENQDRQKQIQLIKISGHKLKMISDVDCISLLNSLEIQEHAESFEKNQLEILRDYEIINQHKLKKNQQLAKAFNKHSKQ